MLSSLSPYELLCSSKPKHVAAPTSVNDHYSAAHAESIDTLQLFSLDRETDPGIKGNLFFSTTPPAKRTHYIADIHARHNAAIRFSQSRHMTP